MRSELILVFILSVAVDRLFGEPPDAIHPTVFMGKVIEFMERRNLSGAFIFLAITLSFSLPTFFVLRTLSGALKLIVAVLVLKTTFSWRGLRDYTLPITKAVEKGGIAKAREGLPFIAGRDPEKLDFKGILSTVVESIAESSVDGIISPFFYFFLFSFISLEAGVATAVFFRAANTLDSMLGIPENPKGYLSAKVDELFNLLPARIGALFLLFGSLVLRKHAKRGLAIFKRDRNITKSRNAGQTMSVMAGVLGVRLEKEGDYAIGDPVVALTTGHIYEALKIVDVQVIVFAALMVISWMM